MDMINSVSVLYKCSPFEILNRDVGDFILIVNYIIERGEEENPKPKKEVRDKFWDIL